MHRIITDEEYRLIHGKYQELLKKIIAPGPLDATPDGEVLADDAVAGGKTYTRLAGNPKKWSCKAVFELGEYPTGIFKLSYAGRPCLVMHYHGQINVELCRVTDSNKRDYIKQIYRGLRKALLHDSGLTSWRGPVEMWLDVSSIYLIQSHQFYSPRSLSEYLAQHENSFSETENINMLNPPGQCYWGQIFGQIYPENLPEPEPESETP